MSPLRHPKTMKIRTIDCQDGNHLSGLYLQRYFRRRKRFFGSSAELVGDFWLSKQTWIMIKSDPHGFYVPESAGFSYGQPVGSCKAGHLRNTPSGDSPFPAPPARGGECVISLQRPTCPPSTLRARDRLFRWPGERGEQGAERSCFQGNDN